MATRASNAESKNNAPKTTKVTTVHLLIIYHLIIYLCLKYHHLS